ncbi:hypothetical protein HD554DRAFT_687833 [Boletus coccyginus]|nr:hypothetical protein HD554DRAFT_687833 [Boletus coccyginus]
MSTVFVTVSATVTATATGSGDPVSLSAGTIAGIIIGTLLGGVLFIGLALYLLNRRARHKFTRVANPRHGAPDLPRTSSRRTNSYTHHLQRPSISSEPLISPASWPPLPATSRVLSPSPPRLDLNLPGVGDSPSSTFDFGEISLAIASESMSRSALPPHQGLSGTPPHARRPSDDGATGPSPPPKPDNTFFIHRMDGATNPSPPPKPNNNFFIHRMLQSRARASEGTSLAHRLSPDFLQSRSTTPDSPGVRVDIERLLADVERAALEDAERGEGVMAEGDEDLDELCSTESVYSQLSAPIDHSGFFSEPVSRRNSSLLPHRKSSRRRARTPAPSTTDLLPVAEVPDTPRALVGQTVSRPVSTAAGSSLDVQVSHRTASPPMSSVVDQPGTFPLLTSANFGKDSTTSGTSAGSISSNAGWGSSSSGRASRYPSLASRSGPRSDAGTDWHHPPSGLGGLTSLQIGTLLNPHSPVEEQPEESEVSPARSLAYPAPVKRAHLRESTASSMPEVERRDVMQGGIAHIDVAL